MSKSLSPFTKAQLLPQEETLEIFKQKGELFIGIPKETHFQHRPPIDLTSMIKWRHRLGEEGMETGQSLFTKLTFTFR